MLSMLDQLIQYKWWANNNLFRTIEQHQGAAEDEELRKMLLHILEWKFVREHEMPLPDKLAGLIERFKQTERLEMSGFRRRPSQTAGTRSSPGVRISGAQAAIQACFDSHGHRAQCATRLRSLSGTPAGMDYVLWVKETSVSK